METQDLASDLSRTRSSGQSELKEPLGAHRTGPGTSSGLNLARGQVSTLSGDACLKRASAQDLSQASPDEVCGSILSSEQVLLGHRPRLCEARGSSDPLKRGRGNAGSGLGRVPAVSCVARQALGAQYWLLSGFYLATELVSASPSGHRTLLKEAVETQDLGSDGSQWSPDKRIGLNSTSRSNSEALQSSSVRSCHGSRVHQWAQDLSKPTVYAP